jgi:hypothetical protein
LDRIGALGQTLGNELRGFLSIAFTNGLRYLGKKLRVNHEQTPLSRLLDRFLRNA